MAVNELHVIAKIKLITSVWNSMFSVQNIEIFCELRCEIKLLLKINDTKNKQHLRATRSESSTY